MASDDKLSSGGEPGKASAPYREPPGAWIKKRSELLQMLRFSAVGWDSYAMSDPTPENREIASVLMALAISAGLVSQWGTTRNGQFTPSPPVSQLAWRKEAARKTHRFLGMPLLSGDLEDQRGFLEMFVRQGDERAARKSVQYLAGLPRGTLIRTHAPLIPSDAKAYTSQGELPQELEPLAQAVIEAWAKCRRGPKWQTMTTAQHTRALMLALFRTLGMAKPNRLYAAQDIKAARKHKRQRGGVGQRS